MTSPFNARPYRRRFPNPNEWPSNSGRFASWALEMTRQRVNELSWAEAGEHVADEIEQVLAGEAPMPPRHRRGEPGE